MRKVILMLAVVLAFTFTAFAQDASTSSSQTASGTTTTTKESHTKTAKSAKSSTLTGCVSTDANSEGNYKLTNGHYKKGVELLGNADDIKPHAGHKVQLTGNWTTEAAEGHNEATEKSEKGEKYEKHFQVSNVKMISENCSAGTSSSKDSGASSDMAATSSKTSKKKSNNAVAGNDSSATPK